MKRRDVLAAGVAPAPWPNDWRAFRMAESSDELFAFEDEAPADGLTGARRPAREWKVLVVDDDWASVGSSNLDPLSLVLNLEANLVVRDRGFVQLLTQRLAQDFAHSHEIQPQDPAHPSRWRRRLGRAMVSWLAKTYLRLAGATGRY